MTYYAFDGGVATTNRTGAIEISALQYQEAIVGMIAGKIVSVAGGFSVAPPAAPQTEAPAAPTLDELKAQALVKVNTGFTADAQALIGAYPEMERETWPNQQAEAVAWQANNATATPYLDAIAAARGADLTTFRQSVVNRVTQFKAGSAALVGKRQKLADAINAATTPDALASIEW